MIIIASPYIHTAIAYDVTQRILNSKQFQSIESQSALTRILEWAEEDQLTFSLFFQQLYGALKTQVGKALKLANIHVSLVKAFNAVLFSNTYRVFWANLTTEAKAPHSLIAGYQITYDLYLTILLDSRTSTSSITSSDILEPAELTPDEKAAIRYVGGYIIKRTIKYITEKAIDNKEACLYTTFHLLEDPESSDKAVDIMELQNWSKIVDRGGLHQCTNEFHLLLMEIEKNVKLCCCERTLTNELPFMELKENLLKNQFIMNLWTSCIDDTSPDEVMTELLKIILDQYLKIRGFAYAAHFMERYKYSHQKNVVKTKSLRTKLQNSEE